MCDCYIGWSTVSKNYKEEDVKQYSVLFDVLSKQKIKHPSIHKKNFDSENQ